MTKFRVTENGPVWKIPDLDFLLGTWFGARWRVLMGCEKCRSVCSTYGAGELDCKCCRDHRADRKAATSPHKPLLPMAEFIDRVSRREVAA